MAERLYKVTSVVDGDTFHVSPQWTHHGHTGTSVRLRGIDAPEMGEPGAQAAKNKLTQAIDGKHVALRNRAIGHYRRLICDVYVGGGYTNVKDSL